MISMQNHMPIILIVLNFDILVFKSKKYYKLNQLL